MNRLISPALLILACHATLCAQSPAPRLRSDPPVIASSWDDLLPGVKTREDWEKHRAVLKQRYLELIRDQHKPAKAPLDLKVHEETEIEGKYRRLYISYQVEAGERAHAYLGIPMNLESKAPAVVALHGTTAEGTKQTVAINGNPDKAFLDHLCRRGYVVIAPEHFVSGERIPAKGAYDTFAALNDGIPLTQRQRTLMLLKIADVYELIGKPENFAFFIHGRGHVVPHESRELIYGFLDAHLKPEEATKTRLLTP